ncbi:DUF1315 family protein [Microbulbifer salipaludis]|uniref:DUF1315 family protein n=1 Tax=Microbulbifer salipaludis TaxID=187980 RepID=A0ABS3E5D3_9GAMM|nr:DUF1315 family protein [Microbulbifer salipaludis]MBN8430520.1 DUF1315 family protein [Microbulbifer salipaludis]
MFDSLDDLLKILNPQIVGSLKRAIELGKWPNGVALTEQQRLLCGEAVVYWEQRNATPESRVGYVPPKATPCADKHEDETVTWVDG